MNLLRLAPAILLLAFTSALPLTAADPKPDSPAAVVQSLYHYSQSHFGFSADIVKGTKPWVTPELYTRMLKKANAPVAKGDAPDIEGDLFLDSQEPPTKFVIGETGLKKTAATVDVTLVWPGEKRPITVLLIKVDDAWKVYDVNYGKDGKDGKLTDQLK